MRYFAIKAPNNGSPFYWWFGSSEHDSWNEFFKRSNREGEMNGYRLPLSEAISAYKSIGYECVELELKELQ